MYIRYNKYEHHSLRHYDVDKGSSRLPAPAVGSRLTRFGSCPRLRLRLPLKSVRWPLHSHTTAARWSTSSPSTDPAEIRPGARQDVEMLRGTSHCPRWKQLTLS